MPRTEAAQMEDSEKDQSSIHYETTTSDEDIDPYCEICVEDKKRRIAAVGLCEECNTFMCQQCLGSHYKWPKLRNHTILLGDEMPRTQAEKPVKFPDCEMHKERVIDHFCLDHNEMLCAECIKSFHGACKRATIHELCQTLDKGDVRKFRDSIQDVIGTASSVKLTIQQNKDDIEKQSKTIIKEVEDLKKRLDTKIKSFTSNDTSVTELCKHETSVLENRIEAASNVMQSLKNESYILDEFDGDTVTSNMFIELRKIAENTNEANKQLGNVCNQHRNVRISFVPNSAITSFLLSKSYLGKTVRETADSDVVASIPEIHFPPKPPSKSESQSLEINKRTHLLFLLAYLLVYLLVFLPYPPQAVNKWSDTIDVRIRKPCDIFKITLSKKPTVYDLSQNCIIRGMVVTATGTLLLTDSHNKKLKAFSSDGTFLSSLSLSAGPISIALINATTAVVSTLGRKLHYLDVSLPSVLSIQRSISLWYFVDDVSVYNDKLIVIAWWYDSKKRDCLVQMLDVDGHEIWSTSSDSSGQPLFEYPLYLITRVINDTASVIVTNRGKDQIVFLDVDDGELINTIVVEGKGPTGLTVDNDDNVYISYWKSSEISVWSPDFSQSRILLSDNQLFGNPQNIVYSNITRELFIRYWFSSYQLDRFQVTCE